MPLYTFVCSDDQCGYSEEQLLKHNEINTVLVCPNCDGDLAWKGTESPVIDDKEGRGASGHRVRKMTPIMNDGTKPRMR